MLKGQVKQEAAQLALKVVQIGFLSMSIQITLYWYIQQLLPVVAT